VTGPPATATTVAAVLPTAGARAALGPVGSGDVRVTGGFWADRARINREATIPAGFEQLGAAGTLENFRLAARAARDGHRALGIMFDKPFPFLDSDVYKWLEGAGWELAREPDPAIATMADEAIGLLEGAQRPDGYLNTFVQVLTPGNEFRDLQWGHELYCIGHLVQAAIEAVAIPDGAVPRDQPLDELPRADVGLRVDAVVGGTPAEVDAIPYFAWANRGPGGMRVWIPRAHS
jgi:DUF1680 family protein